MPEVWKTIPGLKVVSLLLYRGHATDKTKVLLEAVAKIVDPKTLEEVAKDLAVLDWLLSKTASECQPKR